VPLDEAAVMASVAKTRRAVVVHEAVRTCGFGAELSSRIHEELFGQLAGPVQRVGGADTPVPYARNLEADFVPQQADIIAAVRRTLG
jgi:pyruvate dehydrogenase E1 component beta subunit